MIAPNTAEAARHVEMAALETVRAYRATEQMKALVQMLDAMVAEYQARLIDCPEAEVPRIRVAAQQIQKLRHALTADDLNRVALTV